MITMFAYVILLTNLRLLVHARESSDRIVFLVTCRGGAVK